MSGQQPDGGPQMVVVEFGVNLMGYRPGERIEVVATPEIRRLAAGGAIWILPAPAPGRTDSR